MTAISIRKTKTNQYAVKLTPPRLKYDAHHRPVKTKPLAAFINELGARLSRHIKRLTGESLAIHTNDGQDRVAQVGDKMEISMSIPSDKDSLTIRHADGEIIYTFKSPYKWT